MVATAEVNAILHRISSSRFGLVTKDLARAAGITDKQLRRCVKTGLLVVEHPGVLRVAAVPPSFEQKQMALCLWAGSGWLASGLAAARLWKLDGIRNPVPEIAGPGRINRVPTGTLVREKAILLPGDATTQRGIPITSAARTVIDVASRLGTNELERALEAAIRQGLLTPLYLMKRMATLQSRGRKGLPELQRVLVRRGDAPPSDSDFEILLIQALRMYGVPEPDRQVRVYDDEGFIGRVDFIYPGARLLIEADGRDHLFSMQGWQTDIDKRNRLIALGYRILVVTWRALRETPGQIAAQVRRALGN